VVAGERSGDRVIKQIVEYAPRRLIDIYGSVAAAPAALLWHGRGPDERAVLEPLARLAGERDHRGVEVQQHPMLAFEP
jgi:hypothetical protein